MGPSKRDPIELELLYFDSCPSWAQVAAAVEGLAREGLPVRLRLVVVGSSEEAERLGFPGSPTLRVLGRDLFPLAGKPAMGCRIYQTPQGLRGWPTRAQIEQALVGLLLREDAEERA